MLVPQNPLMGVESSSPVMGSSSPWQVVYWKHPCSGGQSKTLNPEHDWPQVVLASSKLAPQ
jgi:hypothetical protein